MPLPWEKKFWTGQKGGLDIWDIGTGGQSELASQVVGGDNPLQSARRVGSGAKSMWGDVTGQTAAEAAERGAGIQAEAGREALDLQRQMYEQGREDLAPWMQAGRENLGTLQGLMQQGAFDAPGAGFRPEMDPGYEFARQEGMRGMQRSAAGRGLLGSGATLSGMMQRNQDLASRGYQGAYNRAVGARQDRYNRLANMAGMGQTQSQAMGNLGAGYGQQAGQGLMGIGNVRAAGLMGGAQAKQRGTGQLLNLAAQGGMAAFMSDRRLKKNIKKIGTWKGFGKYIFQYLGSNTIWTGLMADEVKKKRPDAVVNIGGYDAVNYGVL